MVGKFVGAMHKKGSFVNESSGELVDFDNIELIILVQIPSGGKYDPVSSVGLRPEKNAKFPADKLSEVFGSDYTAVSDLEDILGYTVEYFYDSSKKICRVIALGESDV